MILIDVIFTFVKNFKKLQTFFLIYILTRLFSNYEMGNWRNT